MTLTDRQINGLTLQTSPQMTALPGVTHGFTTRAGGVSTGVYTSLNLAANRDDDPARVRENYRRVCAALDMDRTRLVFTRQVHEAAVRPVTAADAGKGLDRPVDYEADGVMTDVPGLPLAAFGADCLTALLYDPVHRAVAAVHAGWRGTAAGILANAVAGMGETYGTVPADLYAALGPCISLCCFETGPEVARAMTAALGTGAGPYLRDDENGKYHVDLKGLNALWLQNAGVDPARIDTSADCTLCRPEKYWSHRHTGGLRGSQAALIQLL